jgi:putrescine transport system permease protein
MSSLPLGSRIGSLLGRIGLKGRILVIAIPTVWLLVFFLIPFLVVAKISFSEAAIARPPYLPIVEWIDGFFRVNLNFNNYLFLLEDPLYLAAYLGSVKIAGVATLIALLMLVVLPFWTSFLLRVYAWIGFLKGNGVINNLLMSIGIIDEPLVMLQTDFAVYIGIVYTYLPFMILPLYANLVKLDEAYLEASSDLGALPVTTFFTVRAAVA